VVYEREAGRSTPNIKEETNRQLEKRRERYSLKNKQTYRIDIQTNMQNRYTDKHAE